MRYLNKMLACVFVIVAATVTPGARIHAQEFVVIVNAANASARMSKSDVSNIFLKKSYALTPVDREKGSKIRESFCKSVHGRAGAAIESYWLQQIFSGKDVPPAERQSDAEVIAFVRANRGAIGYVQAGSDLGAGVRILPLL